MKWVDERGKASFEKNLQAGVACTLEQCDNHVTMMALYTEHSVQHNKSMQNRLVCTESTSRNDLCEQEFNN